MLEKLARTRSRLRPKLRAEARTRSSSGFEYSYSLGILMLDPSLISDTNNIEMDFENVLSHSRLVTMQCGFKQE